MENFKIIEKLGVGTYSTVYKVKRHSDGKSYALKKVKMPNLSKKGNLFYNCLMFSEKANALNEVRILASINDPHVVSYKEAFYDDTSSSLCIVMEFNSGGDLLQRIEKFKKSRRAFSEGQAWRYIIQMLKGLKALHDLQILHRDLKCANVFISGN